MVEVEYSLVFLSVVISEYGPFGVDGAKRSNCAHSAFAYGLAGGGGHSIQIDHLLTKVVLSLSHCFGVDTKGFSEVEENSLYVRFNRVTVQEYQWIGRERAFETFSLQRSKRGSSG